MSKDQALGALIFVVCMVFAVGYVVVLVAPSYAANIIGVSAGSLQFWSVAIVVLVAFLAVMLIGAWIGWTLATTPPPKPLEDLEKELETGKETEA